MKTTMDLPDALYRKLKARAAEQGVSVRHLVTHSLTRELEMPEAARRPVGWRAVFGKAPKGSTLGIDRVIHEEFEKIDLEHWD